MDLPSPKQAFVLRVCSTSHLKTLWEKEKLFSTLFENCLPFSTNLKLSSAKSYSLEDSKICHLGKGLGLLVPNMEISETTSARLVNWCLNYA